MFNRIVQLLVFSFMMMACEKGVTPPTAVQPVPSPAQLAWHEMETNAFVHFTINTFTDKEWGFGDESPSLFNPSSPNVDLWISVLKEAGFKGVILTTKHHDGFCLWPSKYTEHSIRNSPYQNGKGDVVKEVSEACKRYGLKFGIYMSPWDRNRADYGKPEYVTYYRNQLKELFTNYGPVFEMWFDGANGGDGFYGGAKEKRRIDGSTYYGWPETLAQVRAMEPDVIFFSDAGPGVRWVGNERGVAGETNWNSITPDTLFAGKGGLESLLQNGSEKGSHWIPAEVDVSIRPGWFYHDHEDSLVKTPETLFDIYLTSVGRGSTLLLNVPPDKRGLIHERDVETLRAWKKIIDETFGNNLAQKGKATSTHHRGKGYEADMAIDSDLQTYWTTDDSKHNGSIEISFEKDETIKYVVMQEHIKLGQRVRRFSIEIQEGSTWRKVAEGTTIGYKRILKIESVTTSKLRITIDDARACPLISNIGIY